MATWRSPSTTGLIGLLLAGCGTSAPPEATAPPTPDAGWWKAVGRTVDADARQLRVTDAGLRLAHAPSDLAVTLAADGQALLGARHDGDPVGLRTVAAGRGEALDLLPAAVPTVLPCDADAERDLDGACLRGMAAVAGPVATWWRSTEAGLQLGWTVEELSGEGDLRLAVEVEGADVEVAPDGAGLWVGDLEGVDLVAWDADGRVLDVRLEAVGGGFDVVVDVEGARFPVHVDPTFLNPGASLAAPGPGTGFGSAVALGDIDGDGFDDLVVGAPGYDRGQTDEGLVAVFRAAQGGISTTPLVVWEGNADGALLGTALATVDALDDGLDDIVVGAPGFPANGADEGAVRLYLGSSTGRFAPGPRSTVTSGQGGAKLGSSVAVGDLDGDGSPEIVAGAPAHRTTVGGEGAVFVFDLVGPTLSAATAVLPGGQAGAESGVSVAVGDLNGDGFAEVVAGAPRYDAAGLDHGAVFVYAGGTTLSSAPSASFVGTQAGARLGASVAVGDVSGDGLPDLVAGAERHDAGQTDEGRVYVFGGVPTGGLPTSPPLTSVESNRADARFGHALALDDFTGDGIVDLAVGAPWLSDGQTNEGAVIVFAGGAGLGTSPPELLAPTNDTEARGGVRVAVGDIDGDGRADLVAGAPGLDVASGTNAGGVLLFLSGAPDLDVDGDGFVATADCNDGNPLAFPGATELPGTGDDEDCDGAEICYADADNDGVRTGTEIDSSDRDCADAGEALASAPSGDCDDADPTTAPGFAELCDGVSNDCDPLIDEGTRDTDGDFVCDDLDPCPLDNPDDTDFDGVCERQDVCVGDDASGDADADGTCNDRDFMLYSIGKLVPDTTIVLRVQRARANSTVYFMVSTERGTGTTCFGIICPTIKNPIQLFSVVADADGFAERNLYVPRTAVPGQVVRFQAAWVRAGQTQNSQIDIEQVQ